MVFKTGDRVSALKGKISLRLSELKESEINESIYGTLISHAPPPRRKWIVAWDIPNCKAEVSTSSFDLISSPPSNTSDTSVNEDIKSNPLQDDSVVDEEFLGSSEVLEISELEAADTETKEVPKCLIDSSWKAVGRSQRLNPFRCAKSSGKAYKIILA